MAKPAENRPGRRKGTGSTVLDEDFTARRLFIEMPLNEGADIAPPDAALNYLLNVLRLRESATILVFNGRDGEFLARLHSIGRRAARLKVETQVRVQTPRADFDYCFAPLKQGRLDYMVQKATEMGAGRLAPVITNRTQVRRLGHERLVANVIEAAEQCGVLAIPEVVGPVSLPTFLAGFSPTRLLVFCDERAPIADPVRALAESGGEGVSVLVGPEGGFDDMERAAIQRLPNVVALSLGPRILRADTAAVAALAVVQATLGDWRVGAGAGSRRTRIS